MLFGAVFANRFSRYLIDLYAEILVRGLIRSSYFASFLDGRHLQSYM